MGLTLRPFVVLTALVAAGVAALLGMMSGTDIDAGAWGVIGFAAAFVAVQLLPIPIPRGSQIEMVRLEEAVVVPMLIALRPIDGMIAIAAGVTIGHLISRAEPLKLTFNVAQMILATAAAYAIMGQLAGVTPNPTPRAMAAAVVGLIGMFAVNQILVAMVINRATGSSLLPLIFDGVTIKVAMWGSNAAIGLLLVLPLFDQPALLIAIILPLGVLHASYRAYAARARDEQRIRELHAAAGGMARELSIEQATRQLAVSAREVVDADGAEVRLYEHDKVYWARIIDGRVQVGERGSDTARGDDGDRSGHVQFVVELAGSSGPTGELRVWHERTQSAMAPAFSAHERTVIEMLAQQASIALDNALLFAHAAHQRRTMHQVFEHSSEGLLVLGRDGRVHAWNPAMERMSGFTNNAIQDSPIGLVSPQLASIPGSDRSGSVDAVISTADGARRQVRASFSPIAGARASEGSRVIGGGPNDEGDLSDAWVVVLHDTTAEQEAERLKDDFVATVSHELRTPLTAITGFIETMRRDDVSLEPAQVRMFLEIMGEQSARLERMINDLLDMSAIESGRPLQVDLRPVDATDAVQAAVQVFEAARPETELRVDLAEADAGGTTYVAADHDRLVQVLTNLLENACKHGGYGTPIDVRLGVVGRCIEMSVSDHGGGIAAPDLPHLFDRFYVASDSVTRTGGGAGLGLYISRRLLDAMHGSIRAESIVGEGATFVVSLPLLNSDRVDYQPSSPMPGSSSIGS